MKHYKVKTKKANMGAIVNDDSKSDVKKTVRQTARRQMSEARDAKKQAKEFIRDYDEAGGFTFEGQKKQAKQNVRSRFRRNKKDIRSVKKAILKSIKKANMGALVNGDPYKVLTGSAATARAQEVTKRLQEEGKLRGDQVMVYDAASSKKEGEDRFVRYTTKSK